MTEVMTQNERETREFAMQLIQKKKKPRCICLYGDLGSGKTTFTKGAAEALGLDPKAIKSPTYTYMRRHSLAKKQYLYHFDFYRLAESGQQIDELMAHDLEEIFRQQNAWILIEWPERIENFLPSKRINLYFEYLSPASRKISLIEGRGEP